MAFNKKFGYAYQFMEFMGTAREATRVVREMEKRGGVEKGAEMAVGMGREPVEVGC